ERSSFLFRAEDGIRAFHVTGVQTCALPIYRGHPEVEGTLGQAREGMYLVETPQDVAELEVASPDNLAFVTLTTLSVDDAAQVAEIGRASCREGAWLRVRHDARSDQSRQKIV